jgi:hypothetical protein
MQRITWDMRIRSVGAEHARGRLRRPVVPPGKYSVRLTSGGQTITRAFDVKSDPRVAADGVTDGDIAEQVKFQLQVRDALSDARKLQQSIEQAMQKAGLKPMLETGASAARRRRRNTIIRCASSTRRSSHTRHLHAGHADRSAAERAAHDHAGRSEDRQGRLRSLRRSDQGDAGDRGAAEEAAGIADGLHSL